MLTNKKVKLVVLENSGGSTPPSAATDGGVDGWVMLPEENSYFGDSDSELEEDSEGEFLDPRLLEAAMTNNLHEVNKLLEKNANPNFKNEQGHTALSSAIPPATQKDSNTQAKNRPDPEKIKTNLAIIKTLLKAKADPNVEIQGGNRVLHHAAEKHNTQVAKLLLDYKADPTIKNNQGTLPSDCVTTYCDPSLVRLLEPRQISLDRQLLAAVHTKNHMEAQNLLAQNANPNIRDQLNNRGPLNRSIINNDQKMVELLIKNKANVNTGDDYQPLYLAAISGYDGIVKVLIKNKANIAHQNKNGRTASEVAVMNNHNHIAFILQQRLYGQNKLLLPYLKQNILENNLEMVQTLIKRGVDVNAKVDEDGNTAMNIATTHNNSQILQVVKTATLAQKQDKEVKNHLLQVAAFEDNIEMVRKLTEMGADLNAQSPKGNTALHYGVSTNNKELVSLLLQNNADITIENNDGNTPLAIAQNIAQQINSHIAQKSNDGQDTESVITQQTKNIEIINLLAPSPYNPNEPLQQLIEEQRPDESEVSSEEEIEVSSEEQSEVIHKEEKPNIPQVQEEINQSQTDQSSQDINLWGGGIFKAEDMDFLNSEDEIDEEQRPNESEVSDEEIEVSSEEEEATFTAKKALNKNIIALKAAAQTEEKLAPHLETLQKAITAKQQMHQAKIMGQNINDSDLKTNSKLITDSIIALVESTENNAVLNNLLIIATTQADQSTTELLAKNALVDKKFVDKNGCAALHYAAIQGDVEKVKTLLENGADINIKNKYGNTPLHAAVILKRPAAIKLLLENGADVTAQDEDGNTAAHFAAYAGDQDAIKLLQENRAVFTIQDKEGLTSLDRAIKHTKETIDNIDFTAQEQETVWTQDGEYNLTPVITIQKKDSKQKLLNLIDTVKHFISNEGVKHQDNASFLLETLFPNLLKSLKALGISEQNSVDHNILTSLQSLVEYLNEESTTESEFEDLMKPIVF